MARREMPLSREDVNLLLVALDMAEAVAVADAADPALDGVERRGCQGLAAAFRQFRVRFSPRGAPRSFHH